MVQPSIFKWSMPFPVGESGILCLWSSRNPRQVTVAYCGRRPGCEDLGAARDVSGDSGGYLNMAGLREGSDKGGTAQGWGHATEGQAGEAVMDLLQISENYFDVRE